MYMMKSHMEAIALRLQTMQSSAEMARCMKGVTKVMGKMNKQMNLPQVRRSAWGLNSSHAPRRQNTDWCFVLCQYPFPLVLAACVS